MFLKPQRFTEISPEMRQDLGGWFAVLFDQDENVGMLLAGPFVSVTEAEALLPAAASVCRILLNSVDLGFEPAGFGLAQTSDPSHTGRLNGPLGLNSRGVPLSSEEFSEELDDLGTQFGPARLQAEWFEKDPDFSPAQRARLLERAREAFLRYPHLKDLFDAAQHPEKAVDVDMAVDLMLAAGVPIPPKMLAFLFQFRLTHRFRKGM